MRISETETQPLPQDVDTAETETSTGVDPATKKRWQEFRQRIETNKHHKRKLIRNWTTNIDFRRGKSFGTEADEDNTPINLDWSNTKTKQAALFSQIPKARVTHHPESVQAPWLNAYERRLNDNLVKGGIESAMDEAMPDCINAAGFAAVMGSFESITEMKEVPAVDLSVFPPDIQATALQSGQLFGNPIPMEQVPVPIATRYIVRRISPADFLWPIDFTGSDFNNAPWIGHSDRITWAEAKHRFNLTEEDKIKVLTEERTTEDRLSPDPDRDKLDDDGKVGFDEIFYYEYHYDTEAKSFETIHHLVFLHGKTEPVIDEPWRGQRIEGTEIIGPRIKPIQVLTLAYITDEDIPPSDSAIGRSQVKELNKARAHINKQRRRNAPWTWFDVNRLDPLIQQALMRGTWQHAIPVQGDGSRVIGTIQQPAMHQENFIFDKIIKQDLQELWTIGSNQVGVGEGVETKGEAALIQNNFATKIGRERARVASFFTKIAEVIGGLMCVFEEPTSFGEGFDPKISGRLSFSILADSTVLVDSNQRLERLNKFLDTYAKSGWINIEPVLKEVATLVGLDPNAVVEPPKPQSAPPPNISLRLTGGEDMMNPLLLAFMIKAGQAPDPELVNKAKELIQSAVVPQPPGQPPAAPMPPGPPTNVGDANPDMSLLPSVGKRSEGTEGPS